MTGCSGKIVVRDVPIYWPLDNGTAFYSTLVSGSSGELSAEQWKLKSRDCGCLSTQDVGYIREMLEKACSELKDMCVGDRRVMTDKIVANLKSMQKIAKKRGDR